ncbi:MAG: hypothetical protein E7571_00185 [Ruminococcaceae bacterium]|nr:hypothetical protein [Oscillospiraceae bacterium]
MKEERNYVVLDDAEQGVIINCMVEKRNELIRDGKDTEIVDEALLKVAQAPKKKVKVIERDDEAR